MTVVRVGGRRGRIAAALVLVVCATSLAACTPSVSAGAAPGEDPFATPVVPRGTGSGGQSGAQWAQSGGLGAPTPRRGHGPVTIALAQGATLPDALLEGFTRASGFTVVTVDVTAGNLAAGRVPSPADVLVGVDQTDLLAAAGAGAVAGTAPEDTTTPTGTTVTGAPAGVAYARDDVCVLADTRWYAANRQAVPAGLDAVFTPAVARQLDVPDPARSTAGRAFVQLVAHAKGTEALGALLLAGAAHVAPEAATSGWSASGAGEGRHLLVATQSTVATVANNTGTESAAAPVAQTCLARDLYAAITSAPGNPDGAESLVAYLLGKDAQRALATAAAAHPLDTPTAEGTMAAWFLDPVRDALVLPVDEVARTPQWVEAFTSAASAR